MSNKKAELLKNSPAFFGGDPEREIRIKEENYIYDYNLMISLWNKMSNTS